MWNLPMNESPLEARRYIEVLINKVDRKSPKTEAMRLHDLAPIIQWNCRGLKFNLIDLITGPSSSPSCFFLSSRNSFEKVIQ